MATGYSVNQLNQQKENEIEYRKFSDADAIPPNLNLSHISPLLLEDSMLKNRNPLQPAFNYTYKMNESTQPNNDMAELYNADYNVTTQKPEEINHSMVLQLQPKNLNESSAASNS